jgi:hypothetical protein
MTEEKENTFTRHPWRWAISIALLLVVLWYWIQLEIFGDFPDYVYWLFIKAYILIFG